MVTVTIVGLEYQARYTNQTTAGSWQYLAIGEGDTAESDAHTALVSECTGSGMARALATCSYESAFKSVWSHTFTNNTAASIGVNEAAIFDAASAGHMLMRGKAPATKNVAVSETLEVVMKLAQAV
ncbi:MAG: hypothetical protein M0Q92_02830 [Methanoregula sp.]|jgi:hypothetical protein|nr:hypothetical protein [Methanoregula sp.]